MTAVPQVFADHEALTAAGLDRPLDGVAIVAVSRKRRELRMRAAHRRISGVAVEHRGLEILRIVHVEDRRVAVDEVDDVVRVGAKRVHRPRDVHAARLSEGAQVLQTSRALREPDGLGRSAGRAHALQKALRQPLRPSVARRVHRGEEARGRIPDRRRSDGSRRIAGGRRRDNQKEREKSHRDARTTRSSGKTIAANVRRLESERARRFRPPPPPQPVLPPRRRQPPAGALQARRRARDVRRRRHGSREHVRGVRLLPRGRQERRAPDPRRRGLHRSGRPARPRGPGRERVRGGLRLPPDAARGDAGRVPEPRAPRVRGVSDRLLPPAADGQGAPARAFRGAHRPVGMPQGRGCRIAGPRQLRGRQARVPRVPGHLRQGQFLRRDHGPRPAPADGDHPGPAPPVARDGRSRRRDERQPLPAPRRRLRPRGAPLHRHGQDARGRAADALLQRRVLREERRRDEDALPAVVRGSRGQLGGDRRALRGVSGPRGTAAADLLRAAGAHAGGAFRERGARGARAAFDRGTPRRTAREISRAPGVRDRRRREDGVPVLLPHRLGLHRLRARSGDFRRAGPRERGGLDRVLGPADHGDRSPALRPPLRAVPESRSGSRCPTSTSTFARRAAAR